MSGLKQRLPSLAERRRRRLDQLRANQSESVKDANGSASNMLAGALRFLAVAEYVLNKDVKKFQSYLSESAELRCRLFQRYDAGDRISPSYVSMLAYKYLFAALAAGDNSIAKDLAARMGGRQEIEAEYDHPFDIALGYLLKNFVLYASTEKIKWLDEFQSHCQRPASRDFMGYFTVFKAILDRNVETANAGFFELLKGHQRQSKGRGVFKDTEDELLCVWGIGLANLARQGGIYTDPQEPLLPKDLLA